MLIFKSFFGGKSKKKVAVLDFFVSLQNK
jgi:hypothetical protein